MARAHKHIDVRVSPAQFFEVISDYEAYPQILPEMENAVIERRAGDVVEGVFTINLIKRVSYATQEEAPRRLSWSLWRGLLRRTSGAGLSMKFSQGGRVPTKSRSLSVYSSHSGL